MLENMLRAKFKGLPGENEVMMGAYRLMYEEDYTIEITRKNFETSVTGGSRLVMSAAIDENIVNCPRKGCIGSIAKVNGPTKRW